VFLSLQIEGNITVYSDLCLTYSEWKYYCVQLCLSELQVEGLLSVYSDFCLMYSVMKMLCVQ